MVAHQLVEALRQDVEVLEEGLEAVLVDGHPADAHRVGDDVFGVAARLFEEFADVVGAATVAALALLGLVGHGQARDGLEDVEVGGLLLGVRGGFVRGGFVGGGLACCVAFFGGRLWQLVAIAGVEVPELGEEPLDAGNNGDELDPVSS